MGEREGGGLGSKRKKRRRKRGSKCGGWRDADGRGWRLWNRGSMCRPRVQRVASACALTSPHSLSLARSLIFSLFLSRSFLLFAVYLGPLIRRERGDNSSPSLSLDDARFPRTSSLTRPPPFAVLVPSLERADTLSSLSFAAFDVAGKHGPRRWSSGSFPSVVCDTDTVTALRWWGSRREPGSSLAVAK